MKNKTIKRILAIVLTICLVIPAISYLGTVVETKAADSMATTNEIGDTNGDGKIDAKELVRIKKGALPADKAMQMHMEYQKESPISVITKNTYSGGKVVFEAYVPEGITGGTGWWGVAPVTSQSDSIYTCSGSGSCYDANKVGKWAEYEVAIPSDGNYYLGIGGATGASDWQGKQLLIDNFKVYDANENVIAEDDFNQGFSDGLFKIADTGWDYPNGVEVSMVVDLYTHLNEENLTALSDLNNDGNNDGTDASLMRQYLVDKIYSFYRPDTSSVNNDTSKYQVTDELDRELADQQAQEGKAVGIRYFLHLGTEEFNPLYSVSEILAKNSIAYGSSESWETNGGGAVGTNHWWGESLFGYYTSLDKWVVERDVQMLTDAGIDFLAIDVKDGVYTKQLSLLLEVLDKYYDQGFNVPKVTFTSDVSSSVAELKNTYSHLWYTTDTIDGIANMSTVHVAESMGEAMSSSAWYGDTTNHSRNYTGKKHKTGDDALLYGYNFQWEFEEAIESGADVILVENWNEWLAERGESTSDEPIVLKENADMANSSDIQPMEGGYGDDYYMQLIDCIKKFKGNTITNKNLNTATITEGVAIDINGDFKQWNKVNTHYLDYTDEISDRNAKGYEIAKINKRAAIDIDQLAYTEGFKNFISKAAYPGGSTVTFDIYLPETQQGTWFAINWTTDNSVGDIYAHTTGSGQSFWKDATTTGWTTETIQLPEGNASYYIYIVGASTEWGGAKLLVDNCVITNGADTWTDNFDNGISAGLFNAGSSVSTDSVEEVANHAMQIHMEYQKESPISVITKNTYSGGKVVFEAYVPEGITGGTGWWGVAPVTSQSDSIYTCSGSGSCYDANKVGKWAEYEVVIPSDGNYYLGIGGATGQCDWQGKQLLIDNFKIYTASGELVAEDDFNHSLSAGLFAISSTGYNYVQGVETSSPVELYDVATTYTDNTGRNDINRMKMTSDGENLYALVETVDAIKGWGEANCMSLFISTGDVGGCWNQYEYVVNRDSSKASDGKVTIEKYVGGKWTNVGTATYRIEGNKMQLAIPLSSIGCAKTCDLEFKWADNYSEDNIYSFYTQGDTAPYGRVNYVYEYKIIDGYAAINIDNTNDQWNDGDNNHINFVTANKYPGGSVITFDALYPTGGAWWRVSYTTDITTANIWNDPYFYMQNDSKRDIWDSYTVTLPEGDESYYIYICGAISEWGGNQLLIDNFTITEPSGKVTKENFNNGYGIFNVSETNWANNVAVEWKTKGSSSAEQSNQSAELHFMNFDGVTGAWDFITADAYPAGTKIVYDVYIPTGNSGSWWGSLVTTSPSTTSIYDCSGGNSLSITPLDQWRTLEKTITEDDQYFAIGGPQGEWTDRNVFVDNFRIYNAEGKLIAKDDFSAGLHDGIFDIDETGNETKRTTVSLGTPAGTGSGTATTYSNGALAINTGTDRTSNLSASIFPKGSTVTFDAYVPYGLDWWGIDSITDKSDVYIYDTTGYPGTVAYNQNPYYRGGWSTYTWTLDSDGYFAFEANANATTLLIDNVVVTSPEGKVLVKDDFDDETLDESMFDILQSDYVSIVDATDDTADVQFTAYDSPTLNGQVSGDAQAKVDAAYKALAEAGFNKALALREGYTTVDGAEGADIYEKIKWRSNILENEVATSLDIAAKYGLSYYVKDWSFYGLGKTNGDAATVGNEYVNTEDQFKTIIEDMFDSTNPYINHSAYAGNYATDEPADDATDFQALAWQAKYYNQVMADKKGELYVNLLPAYGDQDDRSFWDKWFGDSTDYKYESSYVTSYLDKYLDVATAADSKINYICWDYYPFMVNGHENKTLREENYLYNFNVMAKAAKDNNLELRFTLQSTAEPDYGLRDVNATDLRYQIYTGMAFGVNDFTYYKYSGKIVDGIQEGIFNYETGTTNETLYGYAKEVNREVHAIENWFADYKWTAIMAKQGTNTTAISDNMINGMQLDNSDSIAHGEISSVTATQDTIAGIFEAKDTSATTRQYGYMFVNLADPANNASDTVTINFADGVKGVCVCMNGKQEIVKVSGSYTFTLTAGAGAFIVPIQ